MAKGIIVIDIPQSCEECKFSMLYECGIIYCKAIKDFVNTEKPKPDWCPIEPIKDNHKASYLNRERVIEKPKRLDYYCLSQRAVNLKDVISIVEQGGIDKMNIILDNGAFIPEFAHKTDAGADLRSPVCAVVPARGSVVIDTGVHVEIPEGYTGFLKSKSGLNVKHNLTGEGVIDASYTGSVRVKLYNHGDTDYQILRGDKIIQMVILPCVYCEFTQVEKFAETERGDGGFGSTGR